MKERIFNNLKILIRIIIIIGLISCPQLFINAKTQENVDLYVLGDNYMDYISIPDDYLQEYDLKGHSYVIKSGSSIVIENGIVKPKKKTKYYHEIDGSEHGYVVGTDTPTGVEGEYSVTSYDYSSTTVEIDRKKTYMFTVRNYATVYSQEIMKKYMNNNIIEDMSEYEKAEVCCKFVASYNYGIDHASYEGMIISGSGDCWAGVNALLYMLRELGISAKSNYSGHIQGAGAGHVSVLAVLDGLYYNLEAGYDQKAPRDYTIKLVSSPYKYSVNGDQKTITITQYISIEGITKLEIPKEIDGYTVTDIGNNAFQQLHHIREISIPNTVITIGNEAFYYNDQVVKLKIGNSVKNIGDGAFASMKSLEYIYIPKSVENIGSNILGYSVKLVKIEVDAESLYFSSVDGVLFDKKQTILYQYPAGSKRKNYNMPNTVTIIRTLAFSFVQNLSGLTLSDNLSQIEAGAFAFTSSEIKMLKLPKSITKISSRAFQDAWIRELVMTKDIIEIEPYAFYKSKISKMNISSSVISIGESAFEGSLLLKNLIIPSSVKSIGKNAFYLGSGWSSMRYNSEVSYTNLILFESKEKIEIDEEAFKGGIVAGVVQNSFMYDYVVENKIPYYILDESKRIPIKKSWFLESINKINTKCYTGNEIKPAIKGEITELDASCFFREDSYTVSYLNNKWPGTAKIIIKGNNCFSGKITLTFKIYSGLYYVSGLGFKISKNGAILVKIPNMHYVQSISIPNKVKIEGKSFDVVIIKASALQNHKYLKKIIIGKNVTSIGENAFKGCTNLKQVKVKSKDISKSYLKKCKLEKKVRVIK